MTNDPSDVRPSEGRVTRSASRAERTEARALLESAPQEQIATAVADAKWARAVDLLVQHGERLLLDGRGTDLFEWLGRIPDSAFQGQYRLGLLAAWVALYNQRFKEALRRLAQAERAMQTKMIADDAAKRGPAKGDESFVVNPWAEARQSLAAVRAHLRAVSGEPPTPAEGVESMMLPASADHPVWRAEALVILGRSRYLSGEPDQARRELRDALSLAETSGTARSRRVEGEARVLLGRIAELRCAFEDALAHYDAVGAHAGSARIGALVGKARVGVATLDLAAARAALAEARPALRQLDDGGQPDAVDILTARLDLALAEADVAALSGEHDEARKGIDRFEKETRDLDIKWLQDFLAPARTRLALLRQDEPYLKRQLQQTQVARNQGRGISEGFGALTRSWALLQLGELDAAIAGARATEASCAESGLVAFEREAQLIGLAASLALRDGGEGDGGADLVGSLRDKGLLLPLHILSLGPARPLRAGAGQEAKEAFEALSAAVAHATRRLQGPSLGDDAAPVESPSED